MKIKPKLWLMVGVPGSGKSYFALNTLISDSSWAYVSRDMIRFEKLKETDKYFDKENDVFKEFVEEINYCLTCGVYNNVIADATHLNFNSRMKLINKLVKDIDIIPVVMCTSTMTCMNRNANRNGRSKVPENAIQSMQKSFKHPKYDNFNYTAIMEVIE